MKNEMIVMLDTYHKPQDKRLQIKEMKFPVFQNMMPYRLLNNYNTSASIFWTNLKLELACSSETSVTTYLSIYMVLYISYNVNLHQHCCKNLRSWTKRTLLWDSVLHISRIYWRYSLTQNLIFPEWCFFGFRLSGM